MTRTPTRRPGLTGQAGYQGRSHDAPDCLSYVLLRRVAPNEWEVRWTAECDGAGERTSIVRFRSAADRRRYEYF